MFGCVCSDCCTRGMHLQAVIEKTMKECAPSDSNYNDRVQMMCVDRCVLCEEMTTYLREELQNIKGVREAKESGICLGGFGRVQCSGICKGVNSCTCRLSTSGLCSSFDARD